MADTYTVFPPDGSIIPTTGVIPITIKFTPGNPGDSLEKALRLKSVDADVSYEGNNPGITSDTTGELVIFTQYQGQVPGKDVKFTVTDPDGNNIYSSFTYKSATVDLGIVLATPQAVPAASIQSQLGTPGYSIELSLTPTVAGAPVKNYPLSVEFSYSPNINVYNSEKKPVYRQPNNSFVFNSDPVTGVAIAYLSVMQAAAGVYALTIQHGSDHQSFPVQIGFIPALVGGWEAGFDLENDNEPTYSLDATAGTSVGANLSHDQNKYDNAVLCVGLIGQGNTYLQAGRIVGYPSLGTPGIQISKAQFDVSGTTKNKVSWIGTIQPGSQLIKGSNWIKPATGDRNEHPPTSGTLSPPSPVDAALNTINQSTLHNGDVMINIPRYSGIAEGDQVVLTVYLNGFKAGTDDAISKSFNCEPVTVTKDDGVVKCPPVAVPAQDLTGYAASKTYSQPGTFECVYTTTPQGGTSSDARLSRPMSPILNLVT